MEKTDDKAFKDMNEFGKLLRSPALAYKNADTINKRRLIVSMVENLRLDQKTLIVEWKKPFDMVAKRPFHNTGGGGRICTYEGRSAGRFHLSNGFPKAWTISFPWSD